MHFYPAVPQSSFPIASDSILALTLLPRPLSDKTFNHPIFLYEIPFCLLLLFLYFFLLPLFLFLLSFLPSFLSTSCHQTLVPCQPNLLNLLLFSYYASFWCKLQFFLAENKRAQFTGLKIFSPLPPCPPLSLFHSDLERMNSFVLLFTFLLLRTV